MDPIEFAVRSAFLNCRDFHLGDIQARKMLPRSSNKEVCSHEFRCRCRDGRLPFFGSGQYRPPTGFGKQFLRPATKLCLLGSYPRRRGSFVPRLCSRATARSNRQSRCSLCARAIRGLTKSGFQLSRKIVRCTSRYSAREPMLNHFPSFITTPPILAPWPIQSAMIGINERFCAAESSEKCAVPNRDIGKIKKVDRAANCIGCVARPSRRSF